MRWTCAPVDGGACSWWINKWINATWASDFPISDIWRCILGKKTLKWRPLVHYCFITRSRSSSAFVTCIFLRLLCLQIGCFDNVLHWWWAASSMCCTDVELFWRSAVLSCTVLSLCCFDALLLRHRAASVPYYFSTPPCFDVTLFWPTLFLFFISFHFLFLWLLISKYITRGRAYHTEHKNAIWQAKQWLCCFLTSCFVMYRYVIIPWIIEEVWPEFFYVLFVLHDSFSYYWPLVSYVTHLSHRAGTQGQKEMFMNFKTIRMQYNKTGINLSRRTPESFIKGSFPAPFFLDLLTVCEVSLAMTPSVTQYCVYSNCRSSWALRRALKFSLT